MSVKQIALASSGPPLSSNVLNACIGHVAYTCTLMSLQQDTPKLITQEYLYYCITMYRKGDLEACRSKMVGRRTVKLCDHVDLV